MVTAPFPYLRHFNSALGPDDAEPLRASMYQLSCYSFSWAPRRPLPPPSPSPCSARVGTHPAFLQRPHEICDKNGLLLIVGGSQSQFEQMFNIGYNQIS